MRVQLGLSFDDDESFKGAVESLRFNNSPSDPNASQQIGSSGSSMPLEDSERNEDYYFILFYFILVLIYCRRGADPIIDITY